MSSEMIVVLVLVTVAIGFLVWLEWHSRRNAVQSENAKDAAEKAEAEAQETE
jgi:Flp pilus assembly protein CpaB